MRCIEREFARFVGAGLANTAISYLLYLLLLRLLPYAVSYALAYAAGIAISYGLNSLFVFRQPVAVKKALRYPAVYACQYGLSAMLLWAAVDLLAVDPRVAPLLAVALSVPFVFLLSRRILRGGSGRAPHTEAPAGNAPGGEIPAGAPASAARRFLLNGGLVVTGAVMAVLLSEGLLRLTDHATLIGRDFGAPRHYYAADRENGYDILPSQVASTFEFKDSSHAIWSNELGCFDNPLGNEGPFVLLLGDSTSWGYKPLEALWGSVVERETGVRVLKCAVPGYGTKHEVLKGRKVLAGAGRAPSLILVGHCANDHIDDYLHPLHTVVDGQMLACRSLADMRSGEIHQKSVDTLREELENWERYGVTYAPRHPTLKRVKKFLSENSIVYRLSQPHAERILKGIPSLVQLAEALVDTPVVPPDDYLRILYQPDAYPWLEKAWGQHFENLKDLKRLAEGHGAKILIVLIPTREQVYGFGDRGGGIRGEEANERLLRFFEQQGIPAMDLLPAFRRYAGEASKAGTGSFPPLYWRRDSHGSVGADRLMGLLVARRLLEEGVIDVPDAGVRLDRIDSVLERFYKGAP
jgi:putative flippase GtrA